MSPAKMAVLTEMLFGELTHMGPKYRILDKVHMGAIW